MVFIPKIRLNKFFASLKRVNIYRIANFRHFLMLNTYSRPSRNHVPDGALSIVLKNVSVILKVSHLKTISKKHCLRVPFCWNSGRCSFFTKVPVFQNFASHDIG